MVAETGRAFGTTVRHDWAIFQYRWQARFDARSPEPSARPSAADYSEERQTCTTCLFAESVRFCSCFLQSCAMHKDNAVGNGEAETGRDLVFMTTARLSDLSMPLKGEVRRSPEQSARQPISRSGKFGSTTCLFAEVVGLWKDNGLMLSPSVEHISVWEGVRGRGEIWRAIQQWNTKNQLPKPQTATVATAQWPK